MAIDTQQKRMSVASMGLPWMQTVRPVANPTEAWRLNVGSIYAGLAIATIIGGNWFRLIAKRFT